MHAPRIAILLILLSILSACSSNLLTELRSENRLKQLRFYSEAYSNNRQPIQIDIVFAYRADIGDGLPQSSALWFEQKKELQVGYGTQLDVLTVEISPLSYRSKINLPWSSRSADRVLVYSTLGLGGSDLRRQPSVIEPGDQTTGGTQVQNITQFECAAATITTAAITFEECAG